MKRIFYIILLISIILSGCNSLNTTYEDNANQNNENETNVITSDLFADGKSLSQEKMNDLFVLGKVWGFLKYYHPNVREGKFDWDEQFLEVIPKVMQASTLEERDRALSNWITTLGTYELDENKRVNANEVKLEPDLDWITNSNFSVDLTDQLQKVLKGKRTRKSHYVTLVEKVRNPQFINEKSYEEMKYPSTEYRLLSLFRYWNIIEYYFPNKHLIEEEWDDVLKEFIPKIITASSEQEYQLTLLEIIARIHDTHANIYGENKELEKFWGTNYAPFIINFVENQAVVTGYYNKELGEQTGINLGDVITKINDKPIEQIIEEKLKYISASNYPTKLRGISSKLLRTNSEVLKIEYKSKNNKAETVEIETYLGSELGVKEYIPIHRDIEPFQQIDSNIAYVYPGSITEESVYEFIKELPKYKGLIIDLRSYPTEFIVHSIGGLLLSERVEFAKLSVGSLEEPGLFTMTNAVEVGKINQNPYRGKVIILENEYTQSQAEFTSMAFRAAPNTIIIGSTTAGADGNISIFTLPGGIRTAISGIGVYYPDGTETQRVGIIPDIEVTPTIKGIREGRDEVLEKAIELINEEA